MLHQANLDDGRVFREAARVVSDESVAAICDDLSRKRQVYAEELEQYLTEYESEDHESIKTVVHRARLDLRASFSSDNPAAVLAEAFAPIDDFEQRMKRPLPTSPKPRPGPDSPRAPRDQSRHGPFTALYEAFKQRDAEE